MYDITNYIRQRKPAAIIELMKKNRITILIGLNIFWAAAALIFDWQEIVHLPYYLIPFLIICPIYPLLLAICWFQLLKFKRPSEWLFSFTIIPSIIYFLAALAYYPLWMHYNYFDWLAFGQVFWVSFYGIQAAFLLPHLRRDYVSTYLASLFVLVSLWLQYRNIESGFFDFSTFPDGLALGLVTLLGAATVILLSLLNHKSKTVPAPKP